MKLFKNIESILSHSKRNAFFIKDTFYTYLELAEVISGLRKGIRFNVRESEKNIGLIANDDIETYAAIIALWLEGKAYVPLSAETPGTRNENIINQAGLRTIIDSSENLLFPKLNVIESTKLPKALIDLTPNDVSNHDLVYILFTSGTTGIPKGVPITRLNLNSFVDAFEDFGFDINQHDKCLQMFELTFDLSVMSYLVPLLKGGCIYTIPKGKVKYSYIFELMNEHGLTIGLMVPSILHYLRPYFNEINCPQIRYSLFCGEALPQGLTYEWSKCVPNAKILNVYGPTEDTIFCTHYTYQRDMDNKSHHGILSIGKAMKGTKTIIIDNNNNRVSTGETGELCLGGSQLTPGYWNNEEKNKEAFFYSDYKGENTKFYKTGDLCCSDDDGNIMYLGRLDNQIKVQGFRVELSEIEFFCKEYLDRINVVAIALTNRTGNIEIGLVIQSDEFKTDQLIHYLKMKIPPYMMPAQIRFEKVFPLNINGKTDRKKLESLFIKTNVKQN